MEVLWQKPPLGVLANREQASASGLIGAWLMNEGAGTTAQDTSGYGNHGTFHGSPTWGQNALGQPCLTTGTGNSLYLPAAATASLLSGLSGATIVACARRGATGNYPTLFDTACASGKQKFSCYMQSSGALSVGGRSTAADTFQSGNSTSNYTSIVLWYTWAVTVNLATGTFCHYRDGAAKGTVTGKTFAQTTFSSEAYAQPVIGGTALSGDPWIGDVDYLYLYNRALNVDEVAALYVQPFDMYRAVG